LTNRIKVGILFGGKSGEHEVSIQSAKSVMRSLDTAKYEVTPIGITKTGRWIVGPDAFDALQSRLSTHALGAGDMSQALSSPDTANALSLAASEGMNAVQFEQQSDFVPPSLATIDVVIPVLHGSYGEDGTMQGLLEILDVPYVGAGVLASAVGMDKVFMKTIFGAAGLPQVPFTHFTRRRFEQHPEEVVVDVETQLGYPCFVKPANLGSSVGISKAKNRADLYTAIELAAKYDRKIIVEQGLDVREIEVAVLGNDDAIASVPGEVVSSNEFYDYKAKYLDGESVLTIPAPVSSQTAAEIRTQAVAAYRAVDCSGLARIDFFVEKETNRVLVNEINTMPGFTQFSMYPKLWEATGMSYVELIDRLVQLAIERHAEKKRTVTEFDVE